MTQQQINQVLSTASVIREMQAGREQLLGMLATFDDYVRRSTRTSLRFFLVVLGETGQLYIDNAYALNEMREAGRAAIVQQIQDVERQLEELEMPKE